MKTDIFRGKQPIAVTVEGGSPTVTVATVEAGLIAFSSVLGIGDSFVGLLESADKTAWELSDCVLLSNTPDVFSRTLIKSSTGSLIAFDAISTLSSVAVGGSLLPDTIGLIQLNNAVVIGGLVNVDASGGTNLAAGDTAIDISTRRIVHATLYGNLNPFHFTNFNAALTGCEIKMILKQDGTGGRTITYSGDFVHVGTSTLNSAANSLTMATFVTFDNGGTWWYHYGS